MPIRAAKAEDRQTTTDKWPPTTEHRQPTTEHRAPTTEHRQPTTEHRPPTTENRAPTTEHRQPTTEHRAPTTEHRLPTTDTRRAVAADPIAALAAIRAEIGPSCSRCKLCKGRTTIVFGVGNPRARLMFVG